MIGNTEPKHLAIIGCGHTGEALGNILGPQVLGAGGTLSVFDADPARLQDLAVRYPNWTCVGLMSVAVQQADIVFECCDDRIALKRKVIQNIQIYCEARTQVVSHSLRFDLDAVRGCAKHPDMITLLRSVQRHDVSDLMARLCAAPIEPSPTSQIHNGLAIQ